MAAGKKTGGRRKGSPNKASAALAAKVAASGLTPLDYMLGVVRDRSADHDRRDRMAAASAPYVHPKLSSTEISGKDGEAIKTITEIRYTIIDPRPQGAAGVSSAADAIPV